MCTFLSALLRFDRDEGEGVKEGERERRLHARGSMSKKKEKGTEEQTKKLGSNSRLSCTRL